MDLISKALLRAFAKKLISAAEKKLKCTVNFCEMEIKANREMTVLCFDAENKEIGESEIKEISEQELAVLSSYFTREGINIEAGFFMLTFAFSRTALIMTARLNKTDEPINTIMQL